MLTKHGGVRFTDQGGCEGRYRIMKLVRSPVAVLLAVWLLGHVAVRMTADGARTAAW